MIQRIQTVYLILAVTLEMLCLCMPIAHVCSNGILQSTMYNLWIVNADGSHEISYTAIYFGLLVVGICLSMVTVFFYKNRKVQMKLCIAAVVLLMVYIVPLANTFIQNQDVKPTMYLACPVVALILNLLAYMAIRKDEKLVRSADRLR